MLRFGTPGCALASAHRLLGGQNALAALAIAASLLALGALRLPELRLALLRPRLRRPDAAADATLLRHRFLPVTRDRIAPATTTRPLGSPRAHGVLSTATGAARSLARRAGLSKIPERRSALLGGLLSLCHDRCLPSGLVPGVPPSFRLSFCADSQWSSGVSSCQIRAGSGLRRLVPMRFIHVEVVDHREIKSRSAIGDPSNLTGKPTVYKTRAS